MKPLAVEGAWYAEPRVSTDERGSFREWFRAEDFHAATGRHFTPAQVNFSSSRRGAIRGIHFNGLPPRQAKYLTCVQGEVLDVVTDVRTGSPGFGQHAAVRLDESGGAVFLSGGLGHAWVALTETAAVAYMCSEPYDPASERAVSALDPDIGIDWLAAPPFILSARDAAAPGLAEAARLGLLPRWEPDGR